MGQFVTTVQAGQRLGLTREQILRRIGRGEIAAEHVGGRWLVQAHSVEEYARRVEISEQASKTAEETHR